MKLTKTGLFVHQNREQRISLQVKFSLHSEISLLQQNFATIAKFPCLLLLQFLHSWLDAIKDKSYKLDVNQLNFDMLSLI